MIAITGLACSKVTTPESRSSAHTPITRALALIWYSTNSSIVLGE
jgi:hypothetical protein